MRALQLSLLLLSQSAVLIAIVRRGLLRPFLFFFLYVLCLFSRQITLSFLDRGASHYLTIWALTLLVLMPLQVLAAGEAAYRSLEQFKGLRTGVFAGAVGVAVIVASWIYDLQSRQTPFGVFSQADQALTTTLFLSGLAFSLGLSWINPARSRNAVLHERLLVAHLGLVAVAIYLLHAGHFWINQVSLPLFSTGFLAWAHLIRAEASPPEHLPLTPALVPSR
jgi:hypothetical protein